MRWLLVAAALVALLAGCGGSKTVTTVVTTTARPPELVRVYFARDGKVGPVARETTSRSRRALLALQAAGPTDRERAIGFDPGEAREQLAAEVYTLTQFDPKGAVVVEGKRYR